MNLNVPTSSGWKKTNSATSLPKPTLKKGRSLMDWIRVSKGGTFVRGDSGQRRNVTVEELSKHNTQDDGWIAIGGMVYNVTSYMDFHPGGIPELKRGLGIDATQLFDEVHRWVNYKSMLEPCLIGKLIDTPRTSPLGGKQKGSRTSSASSGFLAPGGSVPSLTSQMLPPSGKPKPRYEWFQKEASVSVVIYTRWAGMREEFVISDLCNGDQLTVTICVQEYTYVFHMKLSAQVKNEIKVMVSPSSGKTEVILQKVEPNAKWEELGKGLANHMLWKKTAEMPVEFRSCRLVSIDNVTHDCNLYYLEYPEGRMMQVPVGHHVHLRASIQGVDVRRSYTAVPCDLGRDLSSYKHQMAAGVYLMIKLYSDGAMTQSLGKLIVGDHIDVSNHEGSFSLSKLDGVTNLILAAAGTGFTPMASLLQHVLVTEPRPDMNVSLLFFNKQEKDILWNGKLKDLSEKYANFRCTHILSKPDPEWSGARGRIRSELLEGVIPSPGEDIKPLFCACGPTPFTEEAVRLALELGLTEGQIHAFLG